MYISANSLGGMSGRLFGGVLADLWGWKASFLVIGIVSLLFVLCFYWLLPSSKQFKKIPFRFNEVNRSMLGHLKNPVLSLAFLIGGLHFSVFLGSFNYITFLLSDEPYRLSPALLGLLFLTYLAGTVGSTLAGRLAQQWGKMKCLKFGIIIFALGLMLTLNSAILIIIAGLIFICFGFFFSHSLTASWVNSHATHARAGASSLYLVAYYLGGSLGCIYLGWFWNVWRWTGVVSTCFVVLLFTFTCSFILRKFEHIEEQLSEMNKSPLRKSS